MKFRKNWSVLRFVPRASLAPPLKSRQLTVQFVNVFFVVTRNNFISGIVIEYTFLPVTVSFMSFCHFSSIHGYVLFQLFDVFLKCFR